MSFYLKNIFNDFFLDNLYVWNMFSIIEERIDQWQESV